ncbi:MAG: hypothetical protein C4K47_08500 [Candidatus Thorarchaeota archaeon]|nr:MAG: hypothetical protein C4K47_08500 [Candidatus Thorarchaeota archaeon]
MAREEQKSILDSVLSLGKPIQNEELMIYSPMRALSRSISASISDWRELLAAPAGVGRLLAAGAGPTAGDGPLGGLDDGIGRPEGGPPMSGTATGGPPALGAASEEGPPSGGPPDGGPPEGGPPDGGPPDGGPPAGGAVKPFPGLRPDGRPGVGIPTLVGPAASVSASTAVPDIAAIFLR